MPAEKNAWRSVDGIETTACYLGPFTAREHAGLKGWRLVL